MLALALLLKSMNFLHIFFTRLVLLTSFALHIFLSLSFYSVSMEQFISIYLLLLLLGMDNGAVGEELLYHCVSRCKQWQFSGGHV